MVIVVAADGQYKAVEVAEARNTLVIDGVKYRCVGTAKIEGVSRPVYRKAGPVARKGNCTRCSGTGQYGSYGPCWKCNGTGQEKR